MKSNSNTLHVNLKNAALISLALLLGGTVQLCQASEYYRWTDENGVVHMTDKKPLDKKVEVIKSRPPQPRLLSEQKKDAEEAAAVDAAIAAAEEEAATPPPPIDLNTPKALRCAQERERLTILQNNSVVHMQDANGNLKTLDESQIQKELANTQKAIDALCE